MLSGLFLPLLLLRLSAGAVVQRPNTTSVDFQDVQCTKSTDWLGHELVIEDCNAVTNKLDHIEVLKHDFERFEFLGIGVKPVSKLKTMQTPRRYTVGKSALS